MAFCAKCGTQVTDDAKFCPNCGATVNVAPGQSAREVYDEVRARVKETAQKVRENTLDHSTAFSAEDAKQNLWMAILCYLGILVLVPIFVVKDSPFVRFHANQGLALLLVEVVLSVLERIVDLVFGFFWPLELIGGIVVGVAGLACFIWMILGIVGAAKGEAKELPVIGKIHILN